MRVKLTTITIRYLKFKMELRNAQKPNHRVDDLKIPKINLIFPYNTHFCQV